MAELEELVTSRKPKPMWTQSRLTKLFVFTLGVVILAMTVLFIQQRDFRGDLKLVEETQDEIRTAQKEGAERSYLLRAEICRIEIALDIPISQGCRSREVIDYYNPQQELSNSFRPRLLAVLCSLADKQQVYVPECRG